MKISKLRIAAATVALGLGVGAAYTFGAGSAAANGASAAAGDHDGSSRHHRLPDPYEFLPKVPTFTASSTTARKGHPLPLAQWSGIFGVPGGKDISPQLSWRGFPKQTKSFVVSMYDPEAPTQAGFFHWIVEDIPATTSSLPENAGALDSATLPAGAIQLEGDAGADRYIGAAPSAGSGIHDYYITITALDEPTTGLGATTSGALLNFEIDSHTIARASLVFPTMAPAK
ncbi:YbhB/YbcL family Raf kinase inhibitor-like protein [Catenulispora sp. NF23]|uniref:YbhB/YbcL family Raf kinase inhibitor-like protein n=1 Tax=Catenulispora pinistramenti TaxID=2705254 RepID=A0ABS5L501_9ACTN|nr:YbhB/YbcL family Raf kinase inhibitor-like protein [Catenulispora pinistramenti]MBS2539602.1 YbhB/YbcL family Raf kinase inhibitor-like protein [Catenulispora pinistramenti]MBS2553315.1 YbhB/YbcL family Raf kinase inhibitor-like protein [Catenulispora pinistramenti]